MPDSVNAALLSMKTGRPVKIVLNRDEEFTATEHRTAMHLAIKIGLKKDGTLLAKDEAIGYSAFAYMTGGIFNWIHTPYAFFAAHIKVNIDGMVDLYTQASDIGQGHNTVAAMICAEELGIGLDDIRLHLGDTAHTWTDLGAWGSRETLMNGNAIKDAAAQVKEKLIAVARLKLGENIAYDLVAKNKRIYLELRPERGFSYYDIVKDAIKANDGVPLTGEGFKSHTREGEKGKRNLQRHSQTQINVIAPMYYSLSSTEQCNASGCPIESWLLGTLDRWQKRFRQSSRVSSIRVRSVFVHSPQ
jgi:CO/xanthine dehydrogenase Mo-binding subunit